MEPMDIMWLDFDFRNVSKKTLLNARSSGHYNIYITSEQLREDPEMIPKGHTMPQFLRRDENMMIHDKIRIKILALDTITLRIQLHVLHGSHIQNLEFFNNALDVTIHSPKRTLAGTRNFFAAVLEKELMNGGAYELPFNMLPGQFGHPGEESLAIDIDKIPAGMYNAPQTLDVDDMESIMMTQASGSTYWGTARVTTVALPWLPFFSHCEGWDSHITLWDLFENPMEDRRRTEEDGPGCEILDEGQRRTV